jgi:hypothetical protein
MAQWSDARGDDDEAALESLAMCVTAMPDGNRRRNTLPRGVKSSLPLAQQKIKHLALVRG